MLMLNNLADCRKLWLDCLNGDHYNSISNQLTELAWRINSYRVINEARHFAPRAPEGGLQINGTLHILLDRCFIESVLLRLRRLTDPYPLLTTKERYDVYSLVALLNHVVEHKALLIRKNFFDAEGLQYNISHLRKMEEKHVQEYIASGNNTFFISPDCDPGPSIERHHVLDLLCRTDPSKRNELDVVDTEILVKMIEEMGVKMKDVSDYVNKKVAHAATPGSIALSDAAGFSVSEVVSAFKVLANCSNFLQHAVLNNGTTASLFCPDLSYDVAAYIEKPLVECEDHKKQLREKWLQCVKEFQDDEIVLDRYSTDVDSCLCRIFE